MTGLVGAAVAMAMLTVTAVIGDVVVQPAHRGYGPGPEVTVTNHSGYSTTSYLAVAANPVGHFRVLYPADPAAPTPGCAGYHKPSYAGRRSKCTISTNGGPFTMGLNKTTGNSCLGTGVTSGRLIHRQNDTAGATVYPGLGLTAAGDFIIGTLAAAHMQQHKVDEWVSAFGWLVRDGNIAVGPSPVGHDMIAPRTLIGTDAAGRLLLFTADGIEAGEIGLTLPQAAAWIKQLGGHNVLNLDGGGSSTFCRDGAIYDHPTCNDVPAQCERAVTSVPCVF